MKIYEIVIIPISGIGTPLKGDTIFGHFCWQCAYGNGSTGGNLDELIAEYQNRPFAVFSSAYPKFDIGSNSFYALKAPNLSLSEMFQLNEDKKKRIEKQKELKIKRWMIVRKDKAFTSFRELNYLADSELLEDIKASISDKMSTDLRMEGINNLTTVFSQPHNSINRITGTTGGEGFAPFTVEHSIYFPGTELVIFVGINEDKITIDHIKTGLESIGSTGFGKDASIGRGRYELKEINEIDLSKMGTELPNACYTISPCVPEKNLYSQMFFTPFVRFGKHGDRLAVSGKPFKNPVLMADEGAIFKPKNDDVFDKPYIGTPLAAISKAEPRSVAQGFSLYIPVNVEV